MSISRDKQVALSVATGLVSKVAGAGLALLALPLVGRSLSLADYNVFLIAMTSGSASALLFGAASLTATARVASALTAHSRLVAIAETASFFICLVGILAIISSIVFVALRSHVVGSLAIYVAVLLTIAQGLFMSGDIYKVSTGASYASNLFQMVGSLAALGLFLLLPISNVLVAILIYFGVPVLVQAGISYSAFDGLFPVPAHWPSGAALIQWGRSLGAPLINSLTDYLKIFGSATVVGAIAGGMEYAIYSTLILLAARIVNPVSLLIRPLLPAYLDAKSKNDGEWLQRLALMTVVSLFASTTAGVLFSLLVDAEAVQRLLPTGATINRGDVFQLILFLVGHAFCVLLAPFFLVSGQKAAFARMQFIVVIFALGAGAVLTWVGAPRGMLISLAATTYLSAVSLCVIGCKFLLQSKKTSLRAA